MVGAQLRHVGKVGDTLRVGLTGGIASGKTTAAAALELCGAPVAFADDMARGLMECDGPVRAALVELLGPGAYGSDGRLNRAALGARLFADADLLAAVNAVVHPAVREAAAAWHESHRGRAAYTVYESALLFETGSESAFDVVVVVHAPRELRLARAVARGGVDAAAVGARMAAQLSDGERLERRGYFLLNDGESLLLPQVCRLHRALVERRVAEA